jgi:hypothetical protein
VNNFPLQTGLPRASLCRLFTYKWHTCLCTDDLNHKSR